MDKGLRIMCALMLISKEKNRFTPVDDVKVSLGQFQTTGASWLTTQVRAFILEHQQLAAKAQTAPAATPVAAPAAVPASKPKARAT